MSRLLSLIGVLRKVLGKLSRAISWAATHLAAEERQAKIFLLVRVVAVVIATTLFFQVPPPGVAVAILAVVAACMSIHEHQRAPEKAFWMLVVVLLLSVESRSIFKEKRDENNRVTKERAVQEEGFLGIRQRQDATFLQTMAGINRSIEDNEDNFVKTEALANSLLEKSSDLQHRSIENLNSTTGGDSYAVMLFSPNLDFPYLRAVGKYPLHDLKIHFIFADQRKGLFIEFDLKPGGIAVGQLDQLQVKFNLPKNDKWQVFVYFDALNGHWSQPTELRKCGVEWCESFTVLRDVSWGKTHTILSVKDPQFPKDEGNSPNQVPPPTPSPMP